MSARVESDAPLSSIGATPAVPEKDTSAEAKPAASTKEVVVWWNAQLYFKNFSLSSWCQMKLLSCHESMSRLFPMNDAK